MEEIENIEKWLLAEIQLMREEKEEFYHLEEYNTLLWVYENINTGKYKERMRVMEIDHLLDQGRKYMESGDIRVFL